MYLQLTLKIFMRVKDVSIICKKEELKFIGAVMIIIIDT